MADIRLFRGVRYDAERVDLQQVVCPPYDIISTQYAADLRARSPYNALHLHMPVSDPATGEDAYARAAAQFDRWQHDGVLVRDEEPALYVLEQEYRGPDGVGRRRRGLICRLRVEDFSTGVVLPHERTHRGPKVDRLALLRAARANFSQVLMLYSDPDDEVGAALAAAERRPAQPVRVRDDDGTVHSLQLAVGAQAERAAALFADRRIVIADGHHRYETAVAFRDERRAAGDASADYLMVYLTAMEDPGLAVFPAHRLVKGVEMPPLDNVLRRLERHFLIAKRDAADPATLSALLKEIAAHEQQDEVFVLVLPGENVALLVELRDDSSIARLEAEGFSPALARLPVTVLHYLIFRDVLGIDPDSTERTIDYIAPPSEVFGLLASGEYCAGALLNPPRVEDVRRIAENGETMPHKATYFFPKVLTGLVFNLLEPVAEGRPPAP